MKSSGLQMRECECVYKNVVIRLEVQVTLFSGVNFQLILQETFLVLVFKTGSNSVSKYVSELRKGKKKLVLTETGRLAFLVQDAESVGDFRPGNLMHVIFLFHFYFLSENSHFLLACICFLVSLL